MATYKLIQDVEADDKLLGPLSFRQFIYALVAVAMLYVSYMLYTHHAELIDVMTLPVAFGAAFLAFPFGKDQPTELWAIAKLRFIIKPRRRIWAQSGVKELVTINVPKRIEIQRTNGLSQTEVKSRLQALANTIDSRGWAVKNVSNIYQSPMAGDSDSDRLISTSSLPQGVPDENVTAEEDMLDEKSNPIFQQVDELLSAKTSEHHQELIDHLNDIRSSTASQTPGVPVQVASTSVQPPQVIGTPIVDNTLPAENEIEKELESAYVKSHEQVSNMHALRRAKKTTDQATAVTAQATQSTPATDPVIMNLSQRNDLNVNVISNEANRARAKEKDSDEVLISLH